MTVEPGFGRTCPLVPCPLVPPRYAKGAEPWRRALRPACTGGRSVQLVDAVDDLAHQPVLLGRVHVQPEVAVRVVLNALERLPRLARKDPVDALAHADDLVRLD